MKLLRAPFILFSLAAGLVGVLIVLLWVSIGGWWEQALRRIFDLNKEPGGVLIVLGFITLLIFGLILPAWGGYQLLGLAGAVGGPLAIMIVIAVIDRW